MAVYYYNAQAAGANNGSDKANAFTTFAAAVAAANVDGDIIYQHAASQEDLSVATTYTFQASVSVYCIDFATDIVTDPFDVGGYIRNNNQNIVLTGNAGKTVYMSHYKPIITGASGRFIQINNSTAGFNLEIGTASAELNTGAGSKIQTGIANANAEGRVILKHLRVKYGHVAQEIHARGAKTVISEFSLITGSLIPTNFISGVSGGAYVEINNANLSTLATNQVLVGDSTGSPGIIKFNNCTFPEGYVSLASQTSGVPSSGEVFIYDCHVGSTHIPFEYATAFGSVKADTGKYTDDNLSGNRSYLITTTAKVRTDTPFYCPWIERWHEATAAISPYFAIARDGNATAYTNAEVWAEFEGKVTAGAHIKTAHSDKMALLGTPSAQTTDADTTWTGLSGTNWKGKVGEQSMTPAEPGTISGRIVVGLPNASFNWDTRIRF